MVFIVTTRQTQKPQKAQRRRKISVEYGSSLANSVVMVARECFAHDGYEACSLSDIAKHLGCAKSSVLYHFPSKEKLLTAVLTSAIDELDVLVDAAVEAKESPLAREDIVSRLLDFLFVYELDVRIVTSHSVSHSRVPILSRANASMSAMSAALCTGHANLEEQIRFSLAFGGAIYALKSQYADQNSTFLLEERNRHIRALVCETLTATQATRNMPNSTQNIHTKTVSNLIRQSQNH